MRRPSAILAQTVKRTGWGALDRRVRFALPARSTKGRAGCGFCSPSPPSLISHPAPAVSVPCSLRTPAPPLFSPTKETPFLQRWAAATPPAPGRLPPSGSKECLECPPIVGRPSQPPAEHSPNASSIEKLPGSEGQDEREDKDKGRPAAGWLQLYAGSLPLALPAAGWRSLAPGTSPVRVNPTAHLSSCQPAVPAREPHLGLRCLPAAAGQARLRGVGKKGGSQATNGVKMQEQTTSRTGHPRGAQATPGVLLSGILLVRKNRESLPSRSIELCCEVGWAHSLLQLWSQALFVRQAP